MAIFIYGLFCPVTETIRYIGKSARPEKRFKGHMNTARQGNQRHAYRWIRKLLSQGLEPELIILYTVQENERWQDVERFFIASADLNGWDLTNKTKGGEGLDYIDPADDLVYRKNLSKAMKETCSTDQWKADQSKRSILTWLDPEIAARRLAAMTEAQNRPEVKAKLSIAKKEVAARPEVKAAKSKGTKAAWQNDDYRNTITTARNEPDFKAAQSERAKARWAADPKGVNEKIWTDDNRKAQSDRITAYNTGRTPDPEMVARRNASIKASWARRKAEKLIPEQVQEIR